MTNVKSIMMAVAVVSAFAFVGCSDVKMEANKSPGSETPDDYDVNIKEPTAGSVFDNLYVYGMTGHHIFTITLQIRNDSKLDFHTIEVIRYEKIRHKEEEIIHSSSNRTIEYTDHDYGIKLEVPYQDFVTERNYRLKALNETGHVVDAVNVTITDNGGSS
jgi:hypothetical protein